MPYASQGIVQSVLFCFSLSKKVGQVELLWCLIFCLKISISQMLPCVNVCKVSTWFLLHHSLYFFTFGKFNNLKRIKQVIQ